MFHKSLIKAYICAGIILVICLMPGSSLPSVDVEWMFSDKLVHFLMYIPMVWTLAFGFKLQTKHPKLQTQYLLWSCVIAVAYGILIEFLQFALTPDRAAELYDMFADAGGALFGVLTYRVGEKLILFWNRIFKF